MQGRAVLAAVAHGPALASAQKAVKEEEPAQADTSVVPLWMAPETSGMEQGGAWGMVGLVSWYPP